MKLPAMIFAFVAFACIAGGCSDAEQPPASSQTPNQGIYGRTIVAWGNAPAKPSSTQCVKVLNPDTRELVATGTCSGIAGEFRVALPPGTYLVQAGGHYESGGGTVRFIPNEKTITVHSGEWVEAYRPPSPPGPVP